MLDLLAHRSVRFGKFYNLKWDDSQPQQTAARLHETVELSGLKWDAARRHDFETRCRPMMSAFGYTDDLSYHRDGITGSGIRRL
jgi:hypothetical protein